VSVIAHLALGSNLGDRAALLRGAIARLHAVPRLSFHAASSFHETAPVGGPPGQGPYLNAACTIATDLSGRELLELLQAIENELGRVRVEKDGPRTLDLDLLLYGDAILEQRTATRPLLVPHPRMQDRHFVLDPLCEIAADAIHPVFGCTVSRLREALAERAKREAKRQAGRELNGMRVLVTGSTSGIGRATALELAAAGADVLVQGRRDGADVAQECRKHGVNADALTADLGDAAACAELAEQAWKRWLGLDACVHFAGADTLTGAAAALSFEEKWERLHAVDVRGTIVTTRALGRRMQDRGQGVLVTMGWDQAETGMDGDSGQLFGAAKGAVIAFTRALAVQLAPEVRVNCIAPGWIRTAWGEHASEYWQQRVRRETPLRRWGTPDDIARAVRWLVSPETSFVTGQTLRINGGAVRL
jgi:2-amino-4-hydroxy-6-hydroxymethyldihydropteridine diphosphokinase